MKLLMVGHELALLRHAASVFVRNTGNVVWKICFNTVVLPTRNNFTIHRDFKHEVPIDRTMTLTEISVLEVR